MSRELAEYLDEQLEMRRWSRRELGRQAGISQSSVQRAMDPNPLKPAGFDVLNQIAHALRITPQNLFIIAGLLPREPKQTSQERHLLHTFRQLPAEHQQTLIHFCDYLFTQRTNLFPPTVRSEEDGANSSPSKARPETRP